MWDFSISYFWVSKLVAFKIQVAFSAERVDQETAVMSIYMRPQTKKPTESFYAERGLAR